jgi:hypothetical protein
MNIMKTKIYKSVALFAMLWGAGSCDTNFEEINTNPIEPTTLNPEYLFSNAQRISAVNTLAYQAAIVQQIQVPYSGEPSGGNLNVVNDSQSSLIFNTLYTEPIRFFTDIIVKTQDDPAQNNLYNMARIWRAYCFQFLVDTYGDVPYSDAGLGFLESVYLPEYEESEVIYEDILRIYEEATDALDANGDIVAGDLFYGGDIARWRKLGNSLLLRAGMRYTEINEQKAQQVVAKALDPARGGVMASNEDNAFVPYSGIFPHPLSTRLQAQERHNYYLGAPFVGFLQEHNDPRLKYIAVKYENPAVPLEDAGAENTNPSDQLGFPFGFDENTIVNAPGYPGKIGAAFAYSQLNRRTVLALDRPQFLVTYAQTSLLLAEAAYRGYVSGDASAYYRQGVTAHMDQMKSYSGNGLSINITPEEVEAYLQQSDVSYDSSTALEQINEQYWAASFLQFQEAWANFRRTGYPDLTPTDYPGQDPSVNTSGGGFIRRLPYPLRERSVNTENLEKAAQRMGGNTLGNPVFWDVVD